MERGERVSDPYDVIYADPPWRYDFSNSKSRRIENQYETMTPNDIMSFIVTRGIHIADNAALYLWATAPKLQLAMRTMDAWGFDYKTCAVWDKESLGRGYWWRGQHELLLVGTRGKFSPPELGTRKRSVYRERRGRHSAKPLKVQKHIEQWFPGSKKLELFARNSRDGWDAIGNELDKAGP